MNSAPASEGVITDYEIVTSRKIADLQDKVRDLIRAGAQPLGGIAMLHEEETDGKPKIVFAQAVGRR